MRRKKLIIGLTFMVGIIMISVGMVVQQKGKIASFNITNLEKFDIKNIAASASMIIDKKQDTKEPEQAVLKEVEMEIAPAAVIIPPRVEVYGNMTLEEVAMQINKSLKNDITDKGMVIASKCIELGVDPFIATAIILHETGCAQNHCSNIARNCYNFGGQKGYGCGAYQRYGSIDEGLEGMINNLYRNYYAHGLVTVETIGPRYAESNTWVEKINWYVNKIKNA